MNLIQRLSAIRGSVGEDVVPRGPDGFQDLSSPEWESTAALIEGVVLTKARLRKAIVRAEFSGSTFEGCDFADLKARGALFGIADAWRRCTFTDCDFDAPAPVRNTFETCQFERVTLSATRLNDVTFKDCTFRDCLLQGISVFPGRKVTFLSCRFEDVRFEKSKFDRAVFQDCVAIRPRVRATDFTGAIGRPAWWGEQRPDDPRVALVDDVLAFVKQRLGTGSAAYRDIERIRRELVSGALPRPGIIANLSAEVPEHEREQIDDEILALTERAGL